MLDEMLEPFYKEIKSIEKECGYPIEVLHADLIIETFEQEAEAIFHDFFKGKKEGEIIKDLLSISEMWLGSHLVCQMMIMMDEWENVDNIYEHETLKNFY